VALGVLATVVSGEFRVSWEFLLFDIPLVAVSAFLGPHRGAPRPRRPRRTPAP
jgi:hypothetical protein